MRGAETKPRSTRETIDPKEYFRIVLKHWVVMLAIFLTAIAGSTIWAFRTTPIFRAEARLHVYQRTPWVISIEEVLPVDPSLKRYHQTQVEIIRSRKVAGAAFHRLHLEEDETFAGLDDSVAVGAFKNGILARSKRETNIIEVAYQGKDPEKITEWVNGIVEEYLRYSASLRRATTAAAEQNLNERLPEVMDKLAEAEREVASFHSENKILTFEKEHAILLERIRQLDLKLADTQKDLAVLAASWETIERTRAENGNVQGLPALVSSQTIQALRVLEREAAEALAEAKTKYKDREGNPLLIPFRVRLDGIRGAIERETEIAIESVHAEYLQKVAEEQKLITLIEGAEGEAKDLEAKTTEYQGLVAEADRYRRIYDGFALSAREMESTAGLDINNVTVLDEAEVPRYPIWPRKGLLIFLGIVFGGIGGIGVAFILEYLDDSVRTQEDIDAYLQLPLLGYVPRIVGKAGDLTGRDLISLREPKSTISEFFRTIRTGLLYSTPNGEIRSLVVTSAGPKEGKTTNAINLAITMAAGGSRVLLVDGDLRRSRIHNAFGQESGPGLTTLLEGKAKLDEVVRETGVENLSLIASGPRPPNPAEMLGSPPMAEFLKEASRRFDRVIVDSPPVVAVTDACILASLADGVIQVVASAKTSRKVLERGKEQLESVGARILGVILNDVRISRTGYGYYYPGYYNYTD